MNNKRTSSKKIETTSKSNSNKKYISKPIRPNNKLSSNKSKSNYYKNLYKNKYSRTNEVVINNKTYVLPKHDSFETYFCVWRMYSLIDPVNKKSFIRKFWIVIGKGHKSYRKFENQRDAIRYFRNLKKYAKMKIQDINSKQFVRTIYTIFEMIYQGIDTSKIFGQTSTNNKSHEEKDYVDEYTQLDVLLNSDDADEHNQKIEEDIDKVIQEKEGDTLVLNYKLDIDEHADKTTKEIQHEQINPEYNETKNIIHESPKTSSFEFYSGETNHLGLLDRQMDKTPILGQTQINYFDNMNQKESLNPSYSNQQSQRFDTSTSDFSSHSNELNYSNNDTEVVIYKSDDTNVLSINDSNNNKTSLYESITNSNKDFPELKSNDLELEEDLKDFEKDLNIIQHNTSLNKAIHQEKQKRNHKKNTIAILSTILIILIIAAVVVVLLFVLKIIKI